MAPNFRGLKVSETPWERFAPYLVEGLDDRGDATLRSKLPFWQTTGYQHSGIALDPAHKEIILSAAAQRPPNPRPTSGIMNAVITFSWPEVF